MRADGGRGTAHDIAAPVPGSLRAACAVIGVQALALGFAAVLLVYKTVAGHPGGVVRSLLGAAFAAGAAACLVLAARALLRRQGAARSPVVVLELLALPVAYSLWFEAGRVAYGAPIMISALAVIFLLFSPPSREALDRDGSR